MTDRELLELAAKAEGRTIKWKTQLGNGVRPDEKFSACWNPLLDDGDALRLAVKLNLSIDHNHPADKPWVCADRQGCAGCCSPVSCVEDEFDESLRLRATRRAIVRAAAELAKQEVKT